MVKVSIADGEFVVRGTFDFGYMGLYHDDEISIMEDVSGIRDWETVSEALDIDSCTDEEIADFLTNYINGLEAKIQKNIKLLNDNFLILIFDDMYQCGNEFWETEGLYLPEFMPDDPETVYDDAATDEIDNLMRIFSSTPNDGTVQKPDAEAMLRKLFPMFAFDAFISGLKAESIGLMDNYISFQCTDSFGGVVACGAYDDLDSNLNFTDWHNF
ncbi:MAG: hypothetical protein IK130_05800 [Oscillospiraceae bacterium]|nr:hypothetical protein [Oscillospiraceae bacterium]